VRIGRRVFDDGCGIAERTLVSIGDHCTLNAGSVIQCHSMEDGIFKADSCPTTSSPTTADLNRRPSSHTHVTDVANGRDQRADAISNGWCTTTGRSPASIALRDQCHSPESRRYASAIKVTS